MIVFVILLVLLCFYKISFAVPKCLAHSNSSYFFDYLSLEKTTSIKGIFILLILLSHCANSLVLEDNVFNSAFSLFMGVIGYQSVVTMFLFYSGYGVMLSAVRKGQNYVKSIPYKRVFKVLYHFIIAVLLYLILQNAFGETYSLTHILLSMIGWENLGNSNWYIFIILSLYLFSYIALSICKNIPKAAVALMFLLTGALIVVLYYTKQEPFWWDTAICYPLGMLYFVLQNRVEYLLNKKKEYWWISFIALLILYVATWLFRANPICIILNHAIFVLGVLLFTMTVQIHNKILYFFGRHLFSIYILQRLPMLVMLHFGWDQYPYLFVLVSFAVTVPMSVAFDLLLEKADALIFKKKKTLSNG